MKAPTEGMERRDLDQTVDWLLSEEGIAIDPARPKVLVMTELAAHRHLLNLLLDDPLMARFDERGIDSYQIEGYPGVVQYTG